MQILRLPLNFVLIHCGNEFLRSKSLFKNTYNLPLEVNAVDWKLKKDNEEVYQYVKSLIEFRKMHSEFSIIKDEEIRKRIKFYDVNDYCISFSIQNDVGFLLIFINSGDKFEFDLNDYFSGFKKCTKVFQDKIVKQEITDDLILIDARKSGVYSLSME